MPPDKTSKRKAGCSFCRLRHMKCDNAQPACSNCAKRSRECVYESALRIRLSSFKQDTEDAAHARKKQDAKKLNPHMFTSKFQVSDIQCMRLFEFFKTTASVYLDICNDAQHFATSVVELSLTCPMLYYACISYSASVLKRVDPTRFEELSHAEQKYSSECYRLLIPALTNKACLSEPALLSTTVVLRAGEQFRYEDCLAEDPKHHLKGSASLVVDDPIWQLSGTGVREASFWTYLRQDIHMAVVERKACVYTNNNTLQFFSLGSDCIWTNRILFFTVRACNYAFGNRKSPNTRNAIVKQCQDWYASLPDTFEMYHHSEGGVFPCEVYMHPWHTLAMQYYYFALLLLKEGQEYVNARMVVGITLSTSNIGLRLNACHLLEYSGQFLQTPQEKATLLDFLGDISKATGWPVSRSFTELAQIWESSPPVAPEAQAQQQSPHTQASVSPVELSPL